MKKITQLTALAIGLVFIAPSCKKYEEGPSLSFRTKKGRLSGEWTLSATDEKTTSTNSAGNTTVTTTTSTDGTALSVSSAYTPSGGSTTTTTKSGTITQTMEFEKDGTYKAAWTQILTYTQSGFFGNETVTETNSGTEAGTWNFTGGIGEVSKKEQLITRATSSTSTSDMDVNYESSIIPDVDGTPSTTSATLTGNETIYTILLLKNKEMKIKREASQSSSTDGSSGGSYETTSTMTFVQ